MPFDVKRQALAEAANINTTITQMLVKWGNDIGLSSDGEEARPRTFLSK